MSCNRKRSIGILSEGCSLRFHKLLLQYGACQFEQGIRLKQEVVDLYRAMVDRHPDKPELQFELASALADNGELQSAIDTLNKLEKNTDCPT